MKIYILILNVFYPMKAVSFRLPEEYLRGLEFLIKAGVFRSRSEAIRFAVRELLRKENIIEGEEVLTEGS